MFALKSDGLWLSQLITARLVVSRSKLLPLEFVIDDSAPLTAPVVESYNPFTLFEISYASDA